MSVIINPECFQEQQEQEIQDLTVKQGEDVEAIVLQCPQCGVAATHSSLRLIREACGHLKCRLCLFKDETGCLSCEREIEAYVDENPSQILEERGSILVQPPTQSAIKNATSPSNTNQVFSSENQVFSPESKEFPNESHVVCRNSKDNSPHAFSPKSPGYSTDEKHVQQEPQPFSPKTKDLKQRALPRDPQITSKKTQYNLNGSQASSTKTLAVAPVTQIFISDDATKPVQQQVESKPPRRRKIKPLQDHILTLSGTPTTYQCTVCNKTFKTRAHSKYHEFCASGDKPFKCEICSLGFSNKAHFEYHKRSHEGVRPFECKVCGAAFKQNGKLTRHMRIHTGDRPFVCEVCGKSFSNTHSLKNHARTHNDERPHKCEHCGKCFTESGNLKKHLATHLGLRPHECCRCGKKFTLRWALNQHMRNHTGEKLYSCPLCQRSFTNKGDLVRHQRTHTEERSHSCKWCSVRTRRKDNLERHMRNIHPEHYPIETGTASTLLPAAVLPPTLPDSNTVFVSQPSEQSPGAVFTEQAPTILPDAHSSNVHVSQSVNFPETSNNLSENNSGNVPQAQSVIFSEAQAISLPEPQPIVLPESHILETPIRTNAVPVINSAPSSQAAASVLQQLGYTARNLHPETSPHLFIASKNVP